MKLLNYIVWDVNPAIFEVFGREIRYYGLFFALAFLVSQYVMTYIYKTDNKPEKDVESLTMHLIFGTIIGARLGHCLFYDFDYYVLQHPIEILYIWEGGLASHGGALGILTALFLYKRKFNYDFMWVLDRVAIVAALSACFIRMGNLMNSEIVGMITDLPWAFQFVRNDCFPPFDCDISTVPARHPAQLYESISYLLLSGVLFFMYTKTEAKKYAGRLFGIFLLVMFTVRFLLEFIKENQSEFEDGLILNMGQTLSIPFILVGSYFLVKSFKSNAE